MNNYEFWLDIDKIYDAVLAYQRKNLEFNNQFIVPWIKMGDIFNNEELKNSIVAWDNATKLDSSNPQNWFGLANSHFRMGEFNNSILAYQKAEELGLASGDLYRNMALAFVANRMYKEAIPIFEKAIELYDSPMDKFAIWNHIGNIHRKLDNYADAVRSFRLADELEKEIHRAKESLDRSIVDRKSEFSNTDISNDSMQINSVIDSMELREDYEGNGSLILEQSQAVAVSNFDQSENSANGESEKLTAIVDDNGIKEINVETQKVKISEVEPPFEIGSQFVDDSEMNPSHVLKPADYHIRDTTMNLTNENNTEIDQLVDVSNTTSHFHMEEPDFLEFKGRDFVTPFENAYSDINTNEKKKVSVADNANECPTNLENTPPSLISAYGEFLQDNDIHEYNQWEYVDKQRKQSAKKYLETDNEGNKLTRRTDDVDVSADAETKNAYDWYELGNSKFNAGFFDDAVIAYTKAIELNRQFAWAYSNLALTYVQRGRLSEAILLYQRSIELFSIDQDKAMTWNRLGDVYRLQNDYDNAITAYQRADELDPSNETLICQTRFSLLGIEKSRQDVFHTI